MNVALILSGGTGERMGAGLPKQYLVINGKPIISYCLEEFFCHEEIDAVQIVADVKWHKMLQEQIGVCEKGQEGSKFLGFSSPGCCRQLSIYNGMKDILNFISPENTVIIHDAARPLISGRLISACLKASLGHDGAVPVLPMKDSVYIGDGCIITDLLDRSRMYAGQSPECFMLGAYFEANQRLFPEELTRITGSAEPAVLAGMDIVMTPGEEINFKITTKEDLKRFRQILEMGGHREGVRSAWHQ